MTEQIINEIIELHRFFESWLTGSVEDSLYLVTYEEWQFELEWSARTTTALLMVKPSGVQWLAVHESWLPED